MNLRLAGASCCLSLRLRHPGEKVGEENDPLAPLKQDIKSLGGSVAVVESMSAGWETGDSRTAPKQDWEAKRLGPRPPAALVELQSVAFREILSACGVSPSLFSATGTAAREAWRQLLFGVIQPLGKLIESELSEKLEATISFDFFRVEGQRPTGAGAGVSESCRRRDGSRESGGFERLAPTGRIDPIK